MKRTVLWGGRRGDVQYNSRAYWRRTIPIDPAVSVVDVTSTFYFDVGDWVDVTGTRFQVAGMDRRTLGIRRCR